MNEFTKEDLKKYISQRKECLLKLIDTGIIPGTQDSIELHQMRAIFDELCSMEIYFNE
jgi:hypothetical protein